MAAPRETPEQAARPRGISARELPERPYALRHAFASFSIAAGVSLFELACFMGTSVDRIDKTYGHLLPDSLDRARSALDTFINNTAGASRLMPASLDVGCPPSCLR